MTEREYENMWNGYPTPHDVEEEVDKFFDTIGTSGHKVDGDVIDSIYDELMRLIRLDKVPDNLHYLLTTEPPHD